MLHIVIDTSIFRQNPKRNNASFIALVKLCEAELVKVHIPYVIQEEFLSQRITGITKAFHEISRNISTLTKSEFADSTSIAMLQVQEQQFENLKVTYIQAIKDDFAQWVTQIQAEIHTVQPHHGESVLQAYFEGKLPFKQPKNRNDFPDAFIWQTVLDLVTEYGNVHVVSGDRGFKDSCKDNSHVIAHASLEEFIESWYLKDTLLDKFAEMYFEEILHVLLEYKHELTEKMTQDDFWFDFIVDEYMPDHHSGASWSQNDIQNFQYNFDEAKYYGYGLIILPVTFTLDMNLSYFIEKDEYMKDPASTRLKTMQMIRDDRAFEGYYDIEEAFPLQVNGDVFINLRLDKFSHLENIDLQELIRNAEVRLDSIHRTTIDYTKYEGRVYTK